MPVIFICIIMLVLWIRYESNKTKKIANATSEEFWNLEHVANHTRNQSMDTLKFITIPIDHLPLIANCDAELKILQDSFLKLSQEPIVDLSMYTNTELKLAYGTGRFKTLAQYDQNYTLLLHYLNQLAMYHISNHNIESAIAYYEFAVSCKTCNSSVYVDLAKLYYDQEYQMNPQSASLVMHNRKIEDLKKLILQSDFKNKDYILKKMEQELLLYLP